MSFRPRLLPVAATGVLLLAGLTATSSPASAAPPANDDFANAVDIGYETITGSNVEATYEAGEPQPSCTFTDLNGSAEASIWYRFTAPATEDVTMDTIQSESFDTEIAVYTGSAVDALTEVACSEDIDVGSNNLRSQLTMSATQGTEYYVQVSTWTGDDGVGGTIHNQGGLVLNVGPGAPPPVAPPNDNIADGQLIEPGTTLGTTVNATVEDIDAIANDLSGCALGDTVWYGYLPSGDGTAVVDLAGSNFDTALAVFDTDPVAQTTDSAGCNDDNGGSQTSRVEFPVVAGHQYIFQVGSISGQEGDVVLNLDSTAGTIGDPAVSGKASKAPGTQIKYEVRVRTDASGGSAGGGLTLRAPKGVKVERVESADMGCAKGKPIVCSVPALPASGQAVATVFVTPGSEGPFKLKASYTDGIGLRPSSRSATGPGVSLFPRVDDPANNTRTITASTSVVCDNKPSSRTDKDSGGNGGDILCGLGGGDTLKGAGGADLIFGGDGGDTLLGGDGADRIYGGGGTDDLVGGGGRDLLNGGGGTDGCREKSDTQQSCEK